MLKESDLKGPLHWKCDKRVCAFGKCLCVFGHPTFTYEKKPVSVSELLDHDKSDFDLDMRSASPGYFPIDSGIPSPSRFDKYQTTVYGREAMFSNNFDFSGLGLDLKAGTHTVLQYWMWYPYNNWENNHEGDWEMLQVILDSSTKDPEFITYSWHNGGTTYSWSDSRVQKYLGTHPVAYVGSGSHATFWSAGTHHSYQDFFGFGGNLCSK